MYRTSLDGSLRVTLLKLGTGKFVFRQFMQRENCYDRVCWDSDVLVMNLWKKVRVIQRQTWAAYQNVRRNSNVKEVSPDNNNEEGCDDGKNVILQFNNLNRTFKQILYVCCMGCYTIRLCM